MQKNDKDIGQLFKEGKPIDTALAQAVAEAVRQHKLMGQPMAVWKDGKTVWVSPDEFELKDGSDQPASTP